MRVQPPGFVAYLVTYLVSAVAVPLPLAVVAALDDTTGDPLDGAVGLLAILLFGTLAAGIYGLPAAVVGSVLVHLALRRVPFQAAHIAGFAIVGALGGWAYDVWLFDSGFPVLPLLVGGAAAVGRLAAVPVVRRGW